MEREKDEFGALPPPVPVGVDDVAVTDDEAIKALERAGNFKLSNTTLRDLSAIGVYASGVGVMRIQRGQALVTQQFMANAMRRINDEMDRVAGGEPSKHRLADLCRLAHTMGYLAGKMVNCQELVLLQEGGVKSAVPSDQDTPLVQGFVPGAEVKPGGTVIVARDVHMHQNDNMAVPR